MTEQIKRKEELNKKAKKINSLILKEKGTIGTIQKLTNFKEPIGLLMRRNKQIDFYEGLTQDKFYYDHSNGEERYIELSINEQELNYAGRKVRAFIMHEDNRYPLPNKPILEAERIEIAIEKVSNDFRKWMAKEWEAKGNYWWKIGLAIMGIIAVIMVWKMVITNPTGQEVQQTQAIAQAVTNATKITVMG